MIDNLRFDRTESLSNHNYNQYRGFQPLEKFHHEGYIKCKLVHTLGKSIIVPDLIYLITEKCHFEWIQFYSFLPCSLFKITDEEIVGHLYVDISFGYTLKITIGNHDHQHNLKDNSNLFKCRIEGPQNIKDFTSGRGEIIDGIPYIELFHHTLPKYKRLIEDSSFFKCSKWNYQGTKELSKFSYCYFTSLPEIKYPNDLKMIAMASDGKIQLIVDGTDEIVEIDVYREDTTNRTSTIQLLIDTTIIENNHIWEHLDDRGIVYYEKSNAFIYRIGFEVGKNILFSNQRIDWQNGIKLLKYIIIGDATNKDGITAPFNEEETEYIFKFEPFKSNNTNILKFWFVHRNSDLFSNKEIEKLE